MPLPLAPIAGIALRYGAVALAGYAMARRLNWRRPHFDQRAEEAMDDVPEGLGLRRDESQINATSRYRRTIRLGNQGPGIEVDLTTLGRIRLRRL